MFGFQKARMIKEKAKFKINDNVYFRYHDELAFGYIYDIKSDDNGNIIYDVSVGGQCPFIVKNIAEEKLKIKNF